MRVNSKNGIVDRYYWRHHSLTITESFVGRKVDYMKAHDYNSTGRVREIAVQFVWERQIYYGTLSIGLFSIGSFSAYQPTLKYVAFSSNNKTIEQKINIHNTNERY